MDGKVAKKLGDGLMALFGCPVAQENDSERAVRAGLSIQRALAELNRKNVDTGKPVLAARIAVESGPVAVDATGALLAVRDGASLARSPRPQYGVSSILGRRLRRCWPYRPDNLTGGGAAAIQPTRELGGAPQVAKMHTKK
jgi:hypothetical protein